MGKGLVARRPTIVDVARLAGVSKATAARALGDDADLVKPTTRRRVMEAAGQINYARNAIAGGLRNDRTFMVGICIPDITNPFWPEVTRGVQDGIEGDGYAAVTLNSDWQTSRERMHLDLVRRNRFDGLVVNPTGVSDAELHELAIPVVILGDGRGYTFDAVGSNTEGGILDALEYLYDLGHHRIGLVANLGPDDGPSSKHAATYITFHAENGLPLDRSLMADTDLSEEASFSAATKLLGLTTPPTAIFTANDIAAFGVIKAAKQLDLRVPQDLSIVGMDDIHAASATLPALTTVAKPKYDNGRQAAKLLLERMAGHSKSEPTIISTQCSLIVRETTAPPSQGAP